MLRGMRFRARSEPIFRMLPVMWLLVVMLGIHSSCISRGHLDWPTLKENLRKQFPNVARISTQELDDWLASPDRKQPILIDARESEEYAVSHLRNAKLASSEKEAIEILRGVEKDHPVVVYCSVGYRSSMMAQKLQTRGFVSVYNLEGSIFQWANENRPVYAAESRVSHVHPYDDNWGQLLNRRLWSKKPAESK